MVTHTEAAVAAHCVPSGSSCHTLACGLDTGHRTARMGPIWRAPQHFKLSSHVVYQVGSSPVQRAAAGVQQPLCKPWAPGYGCAQPHSGECSSAYGRAPLPLPLKGTAENNCTIPSHSGPSWSQVGNTNVSSMQ